MSTVAEKKRMTIEEFLALPDDGVERWLINGELREGGMTVRNWIHSAVMSQIAAAITAWRNKQPSPRGRVLSGEAGIRIEANPENTVGVDVAYISPEVMARQSGESTMIEGVPTLIVEILSPNDKLSDIEEKIDLYLRAGVPLVWSVNPMRRTVTIYKPETTPRLVADDDVLSGEDVMPGLEIALKQVFE